MKLRAVILKNFRGYFLETKIPVDDLTALIGKNDVGKSTILEALDIFFNQTKVEQGDRNVLHTGEETIIGCVFDDLPSVIALENVSTSLAGEYLLNSEGTLEVWKKYPTSGKQTIWIRAWHPANEGFDDLLLKKNSELKNQIRAAGLENQVNLTINSEMRRALWESLGDTITFGEKFISADQADEKKLWPKIEPFLPAYRLFKADRPSTDEDQEAQDPMQHAVKTALAEQSEELSRIAEEVQRKVSEVATNTIEKLKEFDSGLAAMLTPTFKKEPMWEKAFSFSLTGENAIPLNKRGSGIRRLVLFSFFRATTESSLFAQKNIIYAVEEPETSQHPDAQKMIVNTFREMVEKNGCQIMITTHVPGLAGLLPLKSLRYITNGEGYPEVAFDDHDEEMLKRIADTLGVFPDFAPALSSHHGIKLVVCVEGPNDVAFLTAISKIAHRADDSIIDLNASADIIVMPLGGSALKDWVNHNYLQKLGTPEYHIHDQVVQELFHVQIHIDDTMDVSTEISRLIRAENPEGFSPETVKRKLNRLGAQKMTLELLQSRDPQGEVLGWLRQISEIVRA